MSLSAWLISAQLTFRAAGGGRPASDSLRRSSKGLGGEGDIHIRVWYPLQHASIGPPTPPGERICEAHRGHPLLDQRGVNPEPLLNPEPSRSASPAPRTLPERLERSRKRADKVSEFEHVALKALREPSCVMGGVRLEGGMMMIKSPSRSLARPGRRLRLPHLPAPPHSSARARRAARP